MAGHDIDRGRRDYRRHSIGGARAVWPGCRCVIERRRCTSHRWTVGGTWYLRHSRERRRRGVLRPPRASPQDGGARRCLRARDGLTAELSRHAWLGRGGANYSVRRHLAILALARRHARSGDCGIRYLVASPGRDQHGLSHGAHLGGAGCRLCAFERHRHAPDHSGAGGG